MVQVARSFDPLAIAASCQATRRSQSIAWNTSLSPVHVRTLAARHRFEANEKPELSRKFCNSFLKIIITGRPAYRSAPHTSWLLAVLAEPQPEEAEADDLPSAQAVTD